MKFLNKIVLLALCSILAFACKKDDDAAPTATFYTGDKDASGKIILTGEIKQNLSLSANEKYILKGFVYVTDGFTLTIEPGTKIFGDKASAGTLIVEKGGKLIADGTAAKPIVFTSNQAKGSRNYGDWGGIVLIGKAKTNQPAATKYEGGIRGQYDTFDIAADNSGTLRYVRIEFAGVALTTIANSEINGLTMYGVGSGTKIEYIQVSYSGDDSYEWFGGTVNCKYLIAHRGWDDDWDTDHGFSGRVQYGVSLRDKRVADQSKSNGFESDNDATGSTGTPITQALFANMSNFVNDQTPSSATDLGSGGFQAAMHIRRNSGLSIFNSVMVGYPEGLRLDGTTTLANTKSGLSDLRGNIIANCTIPYVGANGVTTADAQNFFETAGNGNSSIALLNLSDLKLNANSFNLTAPSFLPQAGSPLLSGTNWTGKGTDNLIEKPTFRGAFGTTDWTTGWANFDPQNTEY
jgi:hypothetical protein